MSNRERWVVYPLLFLAIGLGLSNNLQLQEAQDTRSAEVDLLRCKALEVLAADGKPRVKIGTTEQGEATLETTSAEGKPLARISSNTSGASLNLFDRTGQSAIRLGYDNLLPMLLVVDPTNGQVQQLFSVPLLPIQLPREKSAGGSATPDQQHNTPEKSTEK